MIYDFDYIISGAGCAGLSLAVHLIESGQFSDKKILLVDKDPKRSNDRTWCFWESGEGKFESIVHHHWDKLLFYGEGWESALHPAPYRYKMIRGIDFYEYCLSLIREQSNFTIWNDEVKHVFSNRKGTGVVIGDKAYLARYVFNSIIFKKPSLKSNHYWLLQHFKGWIIETAEDRFDPSVATLMDFRVSQEHGTAFCYVLPVSKRRALVEYTLFTASLLDKETYDKALQHYMATFLGINEYTIAEEEFGVIPMTNYPFPSRQHHLIQLGTAGGRTKGSSGYTFRYIQKHSAALVAALAKNGKASAPGNSVKFRFYDSVLLRILEQNTLPGKEIFTDLFKRNKVQQVFKFLDNETSIAEELKLITTLPTMPFMRSAIGHLSFSPRRHKKSK